MEQTPWWLTDEHGPTTLGNRGPKASDLSAVCRSIYELHYGLAAQHRWEPADPSEATSDRQQIVDEGSRWPQTVPDKPTLMSSLYLSNAVEGTLGIGELTSSSAMFSTVCALARQTMESTARLWWLLEPGSHSWRRWTEAAQERYRRILLEGLVTAHLVNKSTPSHLVDGAANSRKAGTRKRVRAIEQHLKAHWTDDYIPGPDGRREDTSLEGTTWEGWTGLSERWGTEIAPELAGSELYGFLCCLAHPNYWALADLAPSGRFEVSLTTYEKIVRLIAQMVLRCESMVFLYHGWPTAELEAWMDWSESVLPGLFAPAGPGGPAAPASP